MNRENDIRTPQGETGEKIPQAPVCVYYCGHEQCAPGSVRLRATIIFCILLRTAAES